MAGGFGIKEGTMFLNTMVGLRKYLDQKQTGANYDTYLDQLNKNPDWHPEGEYDAKAWNQARLATLDEQLKTQGVKDKALEFKFNNYRWQQNRLMQASQEAYAMQDKDPKKAAKLWEKAYEMVHTGDDMEVLVGDKGKPQFLVRDPMTGEVTYTSDEFESPKDMFGVFQKSTQAMMNPALFDKTMMSIDQKNAQKYADQDPIVVKNKEGKTGYQFKAFNKYTGIWEDIVQVDGREMSVKEAQNQGFKTVGARKAEADIGLTEEKTKTEQAKQRHYDDRGGGTGSSMTGLHPTEKLANFYARTYKISQKEATEMIRNDAAKGQVANEIVRAIQSDPLLLDNPEEFKRVREQIIKEFKPTEPGQGYGLPGAAKFRDGKEAPPKGMPDAEQYEGKRIKLKDGSIWTSDGITWHKE